MSNYKTINDKFIFIPCLDEIGNDIGLYQSSSLQDLMNKALSTRGCIGFNTLGYLKSNISNLQPSRYFKENDGIYIIREDVRKEQENILNENNSLDFIMKHFGNDTSHENTTDSCSTNPHIEPKCEEIIDTDTVINAMGTSNTDTYVHSGILGSSNTDTYVYSGISGSSNTDTYVYSGILGSSNADKLNAKLHTIQKIYEEDKMIMNNIFVETGSYTGDGIQAAIDLGFKEIHSIELSDKYYELCKKRFVDNPNVTIHKGDSGLILSSLIKDKDEGITFWLDGHYSSGDTACANEYCSPIQQELATIKKYSHPDHVILIDDMKDFTSERIRANYTVHGKCGYIEKFQLENVLSSIFPLPNTYYFGPACVCYSKNKM